MTSLNLIYFLSSSNPTTVTFCVGAGRGETEVGVGGTQESANKHSVTQEHKDTFIPGGEKDHENIGSVSTPQVLWQKMAMETTVCSLLTLAEEVKTLCLPIAKLL